MTSALLSIRRGPSGAQSLNPYIQVLRAVAILLVVFYHFNFAFAGRGELGVDIFFVISGYLITKQLMSKRYTLLGFYQNRVQRLLPAYLFTIFLVLLFYYLFFGISSIASMSKGLISANTLNINYFLLNNSVNYFSPESFSLPISHLWSLAVEEQFYIFWPLLILLFLTINKTGSFSKRLFLIILTIGVGVYSLLYASSHSAQPWYYFDTIGRVWELLAGALLGLVYSNLIGREPNSFWNNKFFKLFLAFLSTLFILIALYFNSLPYLQVKIFVVLGTVGLIYLSEKRFLSHEGSTNAFLTLTLRVLVYLGGLSYSLYLIHWPVYVFLLNLLGKKPQLAYSLFGIMISLLLAVFINIFVEKRFRWSKSLKVLVGVLLVWLVMTLGFFLLSASIKSEVVTKNVESLNQLQSEISLASSENYKPINVSPTLALLEGEKFIQDGSRDQCPKDVMACTLPSKLNVDNIVIYGDSHAIMWWPAIYKSAMKHNYNAFLVAKGGCPPILKLEIKDLLNPVDGSGTVNGCNEYKILADSAIAKLKPSVLMVTAAHQTGNWVLKLPQSLDKLKKSYSNVILIGDFIYPKDDILNCYSKAIDGLVSWVSCGDDIENIDRFKKESALEESIARESGVKFVNIKSLMCGDKFCPGVVKGLLVYMDRNHISNTYSRAIHASFWALFNLPDGKLGQ